MTIRPFNRFDRDFPDLAARAHISFLALRAASMVARPDAKVTRLPWLVFVEAERCGVGDDASYLVVSDAQFFGRHQAHGGARAADIRGADHQGDCAVRLTLRETLVAPPKLNQKPLATPRP